MIPKILVITGPQGAGNHKFSKVLALHPEVNGWSGLNREHWINHDGEPFKEIWKDPSTISNIDWQSNEYWVLSVSGPYVDWVSGVKQTIYPKYAEVIDNLKEHGDVQIGIIGRDTTIMGMNQLRKRGIKSYHNFLNKIEDLTAHDNVIFLSQELLYLYRHEYLSNINNQLIVPIDLNNPKIHYILNEDPNEKYVHYVDHSWLDKRVNADGLLNDGSKPHVIA